MKSYQGIFEPSIPPPPTPAPGEEAAIFSRFSQPVRRRKRWPCRSLAGSVLAPPRRIADEETPGGNPASAH